MSTLKLKLQSDFRDFYDLWFDREGETFPRMLRNGMDRLECMDALSCTLNLATPRYCAAGDLTEADDDKLFVLHIDPFAHCGEGKVVLAGGVIRREHDETLPVTEYVATNWGSGRSIRHLQIGRNAWTLTYRSSDDWRSNRGDVTIWVAGKAPAYTRAPWPLFAVDFVPNRAGQLLAIDLNTSPGMSGTGMEDIVKPREVVDGIKEWLAWNRRAVSA